MRLQHLTGWKEKILTIHNAGFQVFVWVINSNAITYEKTRNKQILAISHNQMFMIFHFYHPVLRQE